MAAMARRKTATLVPFGSSRAALRLATEADHAMHVPVHDQQLLLTTTFAEPKVRPYPMIIKLALFIAVPAALWVGMGASILGWVKLAAR